MGEIFCSPEIKNKELPDLNGKNVLIIGGTHGIGEALARKTIDMGAKTIVVGLTENDNLRCPQIFHDVVADPMFLEPYFRGVDYVFNNIGIYEKATIAETSRNRLDEVLKTNIATMFALAQLSINHAKEVVVYMSSRPELEKYHSWSLYTLSKQAIITLTKAAAEEGTQKHYAICPSRVDTKFREAVFPGEDKQTRLSPEETADVILQLFNGQNPSGQHYWIKKL